MVQGVMASGAPAVRRRSFIARSVKRTAKEGAPCRQKTFEVLKRKALRGRLFRKITDPKARHQTRRAPRYLRGAHRFRRDAGTAAGRCNQDDYIARIA